MSFDAVLDGQTNGSNCMELMIWTKPSVLDEHKRSSQPFAPDQYFLPLNEPTVYLAGSLRLHLLLKASSHVIRSHMIGQQMEGRLFCLRS